MNSHIALFYRDVLRHFVRASLYAAVMLFFRLDTHWEKNPEGVPLWFPTIKETASFIFVAIWVMTLFNVLVEVIVLYLALSDEAKEVDEANATKDVTIKQE